MTILVAIDGPAGAGKSSVARRVSQELQVPLVDTGAMYRAVGYLAHQQGVALDDAQALGALAQTLPIVFEPGAAGQRVLLDGEDVTQVLRTQESSERASLVSQLQSVRDALLPVQRALAQSGAVMEGRDIGTVVLPNAGLKVFLDASVEERARRRHGELVASGKDISIQEVEEAVRTRDQRDAQRDVAPLKPAPDAVVLDSTRLDREEVIVKILEMCRKVGFG